ncbi:TonB-dependent receptor [Fibrella aquatilis]|uniref:TonB-dependent receptor n=1 Tax=Fibrella aquatilis TaxID=2817059 RepID=A0A939G523_9BACT|nr:TonB-dependent receptor [Fibrella aquatilis]MBO0930156.1 TonB-dependent receptor [Fibrella aquatilis]
MNQFLLLNRILMRSFASFALALLAITVTLARPGMGQDVLNKPVTLTLENVELRDVLAGLENQADVRFIHSPTAIQAGRRVSVAARHERLSVVLDRLLTPLAIDYSVVAGQILLSVHQANAAESPKNDGSPAPQEQSYTGRVITVAGDALPGVNLAIRGTNRGASTDVDGKFRIAANPGEVLVFSFIGYANQQVTLGDQLDLQIKLVESADLLQEVTVIGSRGRPRTDVERPVPVDVVSSKELQATGQVDLGQMVQYNSPSFNSAKTGVNGVANYADPATLRGLSPDQVLVLVDGKRRHQFSALNLNQTVGLGTVVTDLNSIPALALDRMEILRDGAAAQYGSDAIAGIVNLALNKSVGVGTLKTQYGQTSKGDGAGYLTALNYGFRLGKPGSYLNLTMHYQYTGGTNRSDPYLGNIYNATKAKEDSIRRVRGVWPVGAPFTVGVYGSNQTKALQGFYNLGMPLSRGWSIYSFGGYSRKDILAYGFFRNATPSNANSTPELFPDGYVPQLPGTSVDYSTVVGLNRKVGAGWNLDFSTGYGYNYLDMWANNTTNPSLGAASPTNFYVGRSGFGQSTTEANLSKNYTGLFGTKSLNLAFGGQYRVDQFELAQGSAESYSVGPLAKTKNKAPGSSGRPGIAPEDQTNTTRSNLGLYADVESDLSDRLLVAAALRYENYSDFGSNVSGKLAARIKLSESISLRGSINKGFRAPSLQQTFNSQTTSTVQSGAIVQTKQLPSNDARLAQIGIENPKAETSWNYNLGLTAKAGSDFIVTLDAYQIDITDRIIESERMIIKDITALKTRFVGLSEIRFFTNAINTSTKGIDFVTSYKHNFSPRSRFNASLAFTLNQTKITSTKATPSALQLDTPKPILLIDTVSIGLIETAQPRQKILLSLGYSYGKVGLNVRSSYFGEVTAWEKPAGKPHVSQTFGGKNLVDLTVIYNPIKALSISLGGNNIFDVYPDKVIATSAAYSNGEIPYSRNVSQFGFNGAYYYANATITF